MQPIAMGLLLYHLHEADVRAAMVSLWSEEWGELAERADRGECYGKALTELGWQSYGDAMPEALAEYDDEWLYRRMDRSEYWVPSLPRRLPRGRGWTTRRVNRQEALRQLCYGEFNVAYIRGLAHALQDRGDTHAVVYRAGEAAEPRAECSAWEGEHVPLGQVIAGHRARYWPPPGDRTAWSLPTGVNCHHSIHAVGAREPLAMG
jgi:hypothetical protein